mgnify:CR=1 FL=1
MHEQSDAELVEAARRGESAAFDTLFRRYYDEACDYASRFASPDVAPDRVTLAFSRLYRDLLAGEHADEEFSAALQSEVRSAHADFVRRGRKEVLVDNAEGDADEAADDLRGDPLRAAFARLQPGWRKVLWYTVVLGESDDDVAERLDLSARDVAALWHRAHEGLRRACRAEGIDTPDDLGAALTPALLLGVPGLVTRPGASEGVLVALANKLPDPRTTFLPALGVVAAVLVVGVIVLALTTGSDRDTTTADAALPRDTALPTTPALPSSGQGEERRTLTPSPSESTTSSSPSPSETVPTTPVAPPPPPTTPTPTPPSPTQQAPTLTQQQAQAFGSALLRYAKVTFAVTPLTSDTIVVQASNARMMSVNGAAVRCTDRSVSGGVATVTCNVVQTQSSPFALTINVTYADANQPVSGSVSVVGGPSDVSDGFAVAPE